MSSIRWSSMVGELKQTLRHMSPPNLTQKLSVLSMCWISSYLGLDMCELDHLSEGKIVRVSISRSYQWQGSVARLFVSMVWYTGEGWQNCTRKSLLVPQVWERGVSLEWSSNNMNAKVPNSCLGVCVLLRLLKHTSNYSSFCSDRGRLIFNMEVQTLSLQAHEEGHLWLTMGR